MFNLPYGICIGLTTGWRPPAHAVIFLLVPFVLPLFQQACVYTQRDPPFQVVAFLPAFLWRSESSVPLFFIRLNFCRLQRRDPSRSLAKDLLLCGHRLSIFPYVGNTPFAKNPSVPQCA